MTAPTRALAILALAVAALLLPDTLRAETAERKDYLSGTDLLLIGVGSTIPLAINYTVSHVDANQRALIPRPLLGDSWLQRNLGGNFHVGKRNYLAGKFGSAVTPGFCGLALIAADFTWPEGRPGKDAGQDFMLFHSGLMATKGITGITKALVARPRPFLYFHPDSASLHDPDASDARKSFFSGHASSAFYASTYLNKRLRMIMRQRLNGAEYADWRWAPPLVLFGWSSYICWTRIRAYDHYFSDVAVGALVGYLIGELFYSFGDQYLDQSSTSERVSPIFHLSFAF
jgi:membrane-associated phospholipid phosphatase